MYVWAGVATTDQIRSGLERLELLVNCNASRIHSRPTRRSDDSSPSGELAAASPKIPNSLAPQVQNS